MSYDPANVFARILRGEIPARTVYEDGFALAFHDIAPQARVHVLVIPKGPYADLQEFSARASDDQIAGYFRAVGRVAELLDLPKSGYRALSNVGIDGGQEVPHFHTHLFGGEALGPMIATRSK